MYVTICGKILETHSKLFVVGFVVHDAVAAVDLLQEDHLHQLCASRYEALQLLKITR